MIICVVCGVFVLSVVVSFKDCQKFNVEFDKKKKVFEVVGFIGEDEKVMLECVDEFFGNIEMFGVDLKIGELVNDFLVDYDQFKVVVDLVISFEVLSNCLVIKCFLKVVQVFKVFKGDGLFDMYVLLIEGFGLWGMFYGFFVFDVDFNIVCGIIYYMYKEIFGFGGEVDNLCWKVSWLGCKVFGENGDVEFVVIKGQVGVLDVVFYVVDGFSGVMIILNGVIFMIDFWFGDNGFGLFFELVF